MEERCKLTKRDCESKKKIINRIRRIIGQLSGIEKMIEEDRYCYDILVQLSSSRSAIKALSSEILRDHLSSCVKEELKDGDDKAIDEVVEIMRKF